MIDGSDIRFVKWGAVMWAMYNPHYIAIDNVVEWMEWFITISLTHEFIHLLLDELCVLKTIYIIMIGHREREQKIYGSD